MTNVVWTCEPFADLSPARLYAILQARQAVFVLEQRCLYQDLDEADPDCSHLCAWSSSEDGSLLAYSRIVPPGVKYDDPSIGRVLTTASARGTGLGRALVARAVATCETQFPGQDIRIGAQDYLRAFYAAFGFEPVGEIYDEDGIPHIEMVRAATTAPKSSTS